MKLDMKKVALTVMAACALTLGNMSNTSAQTWQQTHPRRAEVNSRLNNQNNRIRTERREGEISGARARQLHREDHNMRNEERSMASLNHGHITRGEQRMLNRQENRESRQIGR